MLSCASVRTVLLPGTDHAIELARLHREPDDSTVNLVAFPPGWTRPGEWSADVLEEVLWLDGDFTMSGVATGPGTHACYPAGFVRADSSTKDGAMALAWFSGKPTWSPCSADQPGPSSTVRRVADIEVVPGPIDGAPGRLLRDKDGRRTWLLQHPGQPQPGDDRIAIDLGRVIPASDQSRWSSEGLGTALYIERGASR